MNSKTLTNLPVLSIADGEHLGTVARAYLDSRSRRIVGFAMHTKTGMFQPQSEPKIDAENVHALGSGGLMLTSETSAMGSRIEPRLGELVSLDDLSNRPVLSDTGILLGSVTSVEFDDKSLALTQVEASTGLLKSSTLIAIDDVMTIGPYLIVRSSVVSENDSLEDRL